MHVVITILIVTSLMGAYLSLQPLPKENPRPQRGRGLYVGAWQCPTLTWGDPTLPSALNRFTAEFEKGSGGSSSLWSSGKPLPAKRVTVSATRLTTRP